MIPNADKINFNEEITPSKTYRLDLTNKRIYKTVDGLKAVEQAIYKILQTERAAYLIYSLAYGSELERYIGKDFEYVSSDIQRAIEDALLADERILGISDFNVEQMLHDGLSITFKAKTVYGEINVESEVQHENL